MGCGGSVVWQMIAYIASDDKEEFEEVKHWKIYLDEEFALDQLDGRDGENFSVCLIIDSHNGMFGDNSYIDDIQLVKVA
jgi:hypothetical protein